ncbi:branched-chain amino acid ABC transporter permease [Nitriliruptor alkaliphilus]|uniref:branched-chain amino acid ABC transporter permease n=1 Tax=Nitriliruptor alkaliphilus TaxID=427918 RepID=UPI000697E45C|nr:branched-chain amino acid ABC transporter permease [Nitriliruptor alkaliphilus]
MRRLVVVFVAVLTGLLLSAAAPAIAQEDASESVRGTIENEEGPVPGVEIIIESEEGEVGTAVTEDDGTFFLPLPGPGDYRATLLQETLPDGMELRNPDRATLEFSIRANQSRPLLYPLGEGGGTANTRVLVTAVQLLIEGIKFGLIIAMAAIGLSLIFGTTGLVNFAHGELVTFGALAVWAVNQIFGVHLIPAVLIGVVIGGMGGMALDLGLWRPLRRRGTGLIAMLVVSIGLSIFLRYLFLYFFDGRTRPYAQYAVQQAWNFGPFRIVPKDLVIIVLSVLILGAVGLMLQKTKVGKAMRAVAGNKDLAEASGIDVERVILWVWGVGGGLATLGGVFFGLSQQVSWQMGFILLLLMFAGVILGGLGTAYGALVGSLVIGIFVQMSTLVVAPDLKNVGALLVMILVLLVRPQGILGKRQRVG